MTAITPIISTTQKQRQHTRKKHALLITLATSLLFAGCQSAPVLEKTSAPVLPRENAMFDTYGLGDSKTTALSDAMNNAEITCRKYRDTRVIVLSHAMQYNGILNEKTGVIIEKASEVLGAISGKKLPSASSDDDYEASITFRCKPYD